MYQRKKLITTLALVITLLWSSFQVSAPIVARAATNSTTANPDPLTPQTSIAVPGQELGPTANQQLLDMAITLKPKNVVELEQFLHDLYDPTTPVFHQFLTPEQYTNRFYDTGTRTQVINFLLGKGFTVKDKGIGSVIVFSGTVAQAQPGFNVTIANFRAADGRVFYANKQTPALPLSIATTTYGVQGLDNTYQAQPSYRRRDPSKSDPQNHPITPNSPSGCTGATTIANTYGSYTPNQFKTAYNFDPLLNSGVNGAGQTVALFELDDYRDANVTAYQSCFGTSVPVTRVPVNGGVTTIGSGEVEVELDIDVVVGMAPGLSQLLVYTANNSATNSLAEYQQIANANLAQIVSSSWGYCEGLTALGSQYNNFFNSENTVFQQMAAQGQSLFIAAGDDGSEGCLRFNFTGNTALSTPAEAAFPYAIGVGGTRLSLNSSNNITGEVTWNDYNNQAGAGGGGVSTLWTKPSWQTGPGTVNSYSNGKRQSPDISADASPYTAYTVYVHDTTYCGIFTGTQGATDCFEPVGGTSAATPLWAAATALLNQYSLSHGQTVFGFGNPALYRLLNSSQAYSIFRDITAGDNCYYPATCGTPNSGTATYPATASYDQATGIGSLNLNQLTLAVNQPTTITLTAAPNPSNFGQSVTFTATVSPVSGADVPTGSVVFKEGANTLTTSTLNGSGVATYITSTLSVGTHHITATYNGDALFLSSNQSVDQVVNSTCTPSLTVSSNTDNGQGDCGTLSSALLQVQNASSPVTITLATNQITFTGPMPIITPTAVVTINGTCTPSSNALSTPGTSLVAGGGAAASAFTLTNNLNLRGVAITGFSGYAVTITGNNNTLGCSWLGTANGTSAAANGGGVHLLGSNNTLGGSGAANLISGNTGYGILVESGSKTNQASYNWVGLQSDGATSLLNGSGALKINSGGQLKLLAGNRFRA